METLKAVFFGPDPQAQVRFIWVNAHIVLLRLTYGFMTDAKMQSTYPR